MFLSKKRRMCQLQPLKNCRFGCAVRALGWELLAASMSPTPGGLSWHFLRLEDVGVVRAHRQKNTFLPIHFLQETQQFMDILDQKMSEHRWQSESCRLGSKAVAWKKAKGFRDLALVGEKGLHARAIWANHSQNEQVNMTACRSCRLACKAHQGMHIRKVVPHAGLPGVFVFDPSYAHWIENTSEASRSSCDISATSLPWLGYLGLFLTDRRIWNPGAGWDADLLLPLLPSRDFRGVWHYGQDLIGNAEFNMLWLSSFHFYITREPRCRAPGCFRGTVM